MTDDFEQGRAAARRAARKEKLTAIPNPTEETEATEETTEEAPPIQTMGDFVLSFGEVITNLRKYHKLSEGGANKLLETALNYHLATQQIRQSMPNFQSAQEPPADDNSANA